MSRNKREGRFIHVRTYKDGKPDRIYWRQGHGALRNWLPLAHRKFAHREFVRLFLNQKEN